VTNDDITAKFSLLSNKYVIDNTTILIPTMMSYKILFLYQ